MFSAEVIVMSGVANERGEMQGTVTVHPMVDEQFLRGEIAMADRIEIHVVNEEPHRVYSLYNRDIPQREAIVPGFRRLSIVVVSERSLNAAREIVRSIKPE